jgi:hypothetical protein
MMIKIFGYLALGLLSIPQDLSTMMWSKDMFVGGVESGGKVQRIIVELQRLLGGP